jgi:choline kinase
MRKDSTCFVTQPAQSSHHGPLVSEGKIIDQKDVIPGHEALALLPIAQVTPDLVTFAQKLSMAGVSTLLDVFRAWINQNNPHEFVRVPPFFWVDIDTPENLTQVQNYLMRQGMGNNLQE